MFDMRDARATKMQMTDGSAYIKAERKRAAYRTKKKKKTLTIARQTCCHCDRENQSLALPII